MSLSRSALRIVLVATVVGAFTLPLEAKGAAKGASKGAPKSAAHKPSTKPREKAAKKPKSTKPSSAAVARDSNGRVQRSDAARHAFARQTGFPNGRPGYVIDHIVPLACGGADAPSNMQWQTVADAKAKDRTERIGCR